MTTIECYEIANMFIAENCLNTLKDSEINELHRGMKDYMFGYQRDMKYGNQLYWDKEKWEQYFSDWRIELLLDEEYNFRNYILTLVSVEQRIADYKDTVRTWYKIAL